MKEFESYRKKRTAAIVIVSTGFACAITGAIIYNNGNKNLGRGLVLAGYGIEFSSLFAAFSGQRKLQRAIWLRNRDVLFSPK